MSTDAQSRLAAGRSAQRCARVRALCDPVSRLTRTPSGSNQADSVRACCSASSSVGAMKAAWAPLPIARAAAAAAMTVLPQPTSPWTSRAIGACLPDRDRPRAARAAAHRSAGTAATRAAGPRGRGRAQRPRGIAPRASPQLHQRQVMCQQLLERQPPLRRMSTGGQFGEFGADRRAMHEFERRAQRRQAQPREQRARAAARRRLRIERAQRTIDQQAQPTLRQALGGRIDRRQRLRQRLARVGDVPVLGVDELESKRAAS